MKPTRLLAVLAAAALPLAASAFTSPTGIIGIRGSAHDLSNGSTTPGGITASAATEKEVCKFCHTPHKAQSTQLVWNHQVTAATTYGWGVDLDLVAITKTTLGTSLATTVRGASKRCFSCHDGTVAIGSLSNIGGGVAGTIAMSGAAGKLTTTGTIGALAEAAYQVVPGTMQGHHPVSIPYAGQSGYNGITSSSSIVADGTAGNYYAIATGSANCAGVAVCTNAPQTDGRNGTRINLIPQNVGATTNVGIECVSCHEVHSKFGNPYLLRINNATSSGLCRSCHNK